MALVPLLAALALHLVTGSVAALGVALREKSPSALLLPLVFLGVHLAYGLGTLSGFFAHPESLTFWRAGRNRRQVSSSTVSLS
jgi:hypothetical protein